MLRVLPNPAAPIPRGTPISLIIKIIQSDHGIIYVCVQYAIICFAIQLKLPWYSFIVELLLDEIVKKFDFLLWDDDFCSRMSVWLKTDSPTGEMIVLKIRSMLENDLNKKDPNNNHNYLFGAVFDYAPDSGHYFLDTNPKHFDDYLGFVCDCMFPEPNVQKLPSQIFTSRKNIKKLCDGISDFIEDHSYPLSPQATIESSEAPRSSAEIVNQNAWTFPQPFVPAPLTNLLYALVQFDRKLVVPAFVPIPQQIASPPVSEPVRNNATDLILAGVKAALHSCVNNAVTLAAKSFTVGNRSTVMAIGGSDLDAQVLATEVTSDANQKALDAVTTASATLRAAKAVVTATDAGESIFVDSPPHSPGVKSLMTSNKNLDNIFDLQTKMGVNSLPTGFTEGVDIVASQIASILAKIEDLKSGTSFSLPDGGRQAPSTTFAQSPMQGVEDGAPGAQQTLFSSIDLERSVDVPNSFGSNSGQTLTSGQSGTSQTHELADLLANLPILSLSSSTTAHPKPIIPFLELTSKGVSPQAQSFGKSSGNVTYHPHLDLLASLDPPHSTHSSSSRGHDIGVGGAHFSDNPSKNAHSNVDARGNPHANLPSFLPQGKYRGPPPVQVLASSGNSPGNPPGISGCADHLKTLSSNVLGSDSSKVGTNPLASLLKVPNRTSRFIQILQSQSKNPSKSNGIGYSTSVPHSSNTMSSESDVPPPLPSSSSPLGGKIGGSPPAHSPGGLPELVPPPAPSLSQELRSAATPSVDPPNENPPTKWGVKIGGIKRSGKMPDIAMVLLLGAHLLRLGVPLFSHIPPAQEVQAVDDNPHAHDAHAVLAA